jgi:hypothetical protein
MPLPILRQARGKIEAYLSYFLINLYCSVTARLCPQAVEDTIKGGKFENLKSLKI